MYPFNLYEDWRIRAAQRDFFSRAAYGICRTSKFCRYWAEEQGDKISSVDYEHIIWVCLRRVARKYSICINNLELMLGDDIKYKLERFSRVTVSEW